MTNAAHSTHWRGLRARCLALASILAILGTVPLHGAEAARPGSAERCSGGDCASGVVRGVTVYRGLVLDYEVIDGLAVHGGDMVLGTAEEAAAAAPSREAAKREAVSGPVRRDLYPIENSYLWPDGRVPYVIHEDIEGRDLEDVHAAIEHWNTKTVVAWFPRTDEEQYALFGPRDSGYCRSGLGRGSPTVMSIEGCGLVIMIHEMGHAVGLLHEQERPDRDKFIQLAPDMFDLIGSSITLVGAWRRAPGPGLERPYDYSSIMHYGQDRRNVETIPPGIRLVGTSLSAGDIDGVARLYGTPPGTITVSTNPPGLDVIVDGESVTTPAMFDWLPDSVHTLEAPLVQQGTGGQHNFGRHVFGRWSDSGGRKHTVQAGPDSTWFEASFIRNEEVPRRVHPANNGTVALSPETPDGRYARGSRVEYTPIPTEGTPYEFARWSRPYEFAPWSRHQVRLPQGPVLGHEARIHIGSTREYLEAYFRIPPFYRISSNIEGMLFPVSTRDPTGPPGEWVAPAAFQPSELPAGTTVSVPEFVPVREDFGKGGRYRFTGWSDGGEREHEIEAPAGGGSLTFQMQREFQLATHTHSGKIVVSPESEDGFYPAGSQVQFTAVPEAGRHFLGWEHDVSGTETTQFVIMDRDRRASAKFTRHEPVLVQSGEPLQVDSLNGRHYVRVPDGASQVAVRFEASAPSRDAAFSVHSGFGRVELGSTRLSESDTITITRDALARMRDSARLHPQSHSHHLRMSGSVGSGTLHVSIQRDWIAHVWPRAFTLVSQVGWSRPVWQTMRIAPVEGAPPQVRYRIVSDQHWLEAVPPEWTSAEGEVEIAVTANGAALAAEAYAGKLKILTVSDGDPPTGIEIPVHFVVTPADGPEEPPGDGSSGLAGGDDHGDTRGAATEIAAGSAARGRLEEVGDRDWFRFRTTATHTWVTAYTDSEGDTVGELHAAGGSVLTDDDSGVDRNFRIVAKVPAGTHYLQVRGFGTADYTLKLEAVADDHGETRGAATEIAAGSAARGRLQAVGDEDWFRFRTTAARTWVTAYTDSEGDTVGELHAAGGSVVTDDDSGSGGNFRITTRVPAGTHYLRVSGFGTTDYTLELEAGFPIEFVRIPAGTFVMGSPEDEEGRRDNERQRKVRISQGFWMGKYEVTQGEWEGVMGANPSSFQKCGSRCPVEQVSWDDVQEFIRRLNEQESGSGYVYRLPTEAEWEYAARAGTTGARYGELDEIAWYKENSNRTTHPVGQKRANAWGLHDMLGNVSEWTADWYGEYPSGAVTDPQGPDTGSARVVRDGGWGGWGDEVRSADRLGYSPGARNITVGFRLVRTWKPTKPTDDQGNTRVTVTEIAAGSAARGRLEEVGDADWFQFRTTAAHTLVTAYTDSEGDTVGELHAAGGAVVTDYDSGVDRNFRIVANVPAGTHYLQVRGLGAADYTLKLEADAEDHGETRGAATEIAAGSAVRGRLWGVGDADWFRFQTTGTHTWVTAYTVSEVDTVGELHPAGRAVVTDDDSGSGGNFWIAARVPAGTHYLRVSGFGTTDYTLRLEAGFRMEFVRIPAGSFVMGSPEDEEGRRENERQHEVRISQGFWMGKYEVTQGEWERVMGENPSYFRECGSRCPVERVSWDDVQEFIRKLNEQESGSGYVYRLPTEAEWEYAARAGTTGARYGELDEIAWYSENSKWYSENRRTHPVGQKRANAWGLHDMLGSVWEWTADWTGEYPSGAVTDPQGPDTGRARVRRGGSWSSYARFVRSACRSYGWPDLRDNNIGFRLVRTE